MYDELQPEFDLKKAINEARVERGVTQAELAARMGVKQSAISCLEVGPWDPRLTTLHKLAGALEMHIEITVHGLKAVPLVVEEEADARAQRRLEKSARLHLIDLSSLNWTFLAPHLVLPNGRGCNQTSGPRPLSTGF